MLSAVSGVVSLEIAVANGGALFFTYTAKHKTTRSKMQNPPWSCSSCIKVLLLERRYKTTNLKTHAPAHREGTTLQPNIHIKETKVY
jgi:hypothetical protein